MKRFYLDLNTLLPELLAELARISENKAIREHICEIISPDANAAAMVVARSLVPFFEANMKEVEDEKPSTRTQEDICHQTQETFP